MAILKAFKGIRPVGEKASMIASRPYDVLNKEEARMEARDNPFSFLRIVKPEIDLPDDIDPYSEIVYEKGKENMYNMIKQGIFLQDPTDCLYVYAQTMNGRSQYGIVGCASVQDYMNNVIKKHELTRPDKEEDRKNHVRISNMNYEPVFFTYPAMREIDRMVEKVTQNPAEYDFTTEDEIGHHFWVINEEKLINTLIEYFSQIHSVYIADGHHRTAAAALVGNEKKDANPNHTGNEEYNFFLAVLFPDKQLQIIDYNRVVKDLNGLGKKGFLKRLEEGFNVECKGTDIYKPTQLHNISMYIDGAWYSLTAKDHTFDDNDPIGVLDVTILSDQILDPLLAVKDLRKSKRIDFVGGIRGLGELRRRVDSGEMAVAFALYPVTLKQLFDISDTNNSMPPKTTWFEPKLRSGLVIHSLE